jgi:sigma-B regulation protein RsbU (phosphoserine phosphatase)
MDTALPGSLKILVLEDDKDDVELIKRALYKSNFSFDISHVENKEEFISELSSFAPDIILSDHSLPQFDSLTALQIVKESYPDIPFVLVTGSVSEEFAVRCIKSGAEDYVLKGNLIRLPSIIESAINKKDLKAENSIIKSLNEKLKNANEVIAQKNKDITDSITYARRIQRAIMPDMRLFNKYFPESFVLYRPKDIISGDFYWFEEYNGKFIIAVGDCTGHGVPGSLLSMIGYHLLKNTVYLKSITDPAGILNEMNRAFGEIFDLGKDKEEIHDGMDIIICSIDMANSSLTFSSARRPMYYTRNQVLTEIKGSPQPIGGGYYERTPYRNESMKIEKNDKYYLFTDGYADQFGGKNGKKFKTTGFKDLLTKLSNEKMSVTKRTLHDHFEKWKREEEQTDDILVVGIEIS